MKISRLSSKLFAAIIAGIAGCGVSVYTAENTSALSNRDVSATLDRQRIVSSLQLDNAVFLSAFSRPVNLPEQPGQPDALSASTNLSLASASILPLLDAPSVFYDLLKRNQLVQIITDIEIDDSKPLTKNIIVTLKKEAPELVRLSKNSQTQKSSHQHALNDSPMQWQAEGNNWDATVLDARHLLITNKQESASKIKSRFLQCNDKQDSKSALSTFDALPKRLKSWLADLPSEPDLWQVLDTNIINSSNGDRASNSFCELSKDKTSMISFVEPGSETLKSVVYSENKKAPDQISRELSDFKEPAEFVLQKNSENKFTITISGVDRKSIKAKVFLLLLTGPLGAT